MSIELLERAAVALGGLLDEVVFVGGASVGLWITDPAAPAPRPTKDVDVVVEVFTRASLHDFEQRLREAGLREDQDSSVMCRWRYGNASPDDDLILDVMAAEASLMGFENRWQAEGLPHAIERQLPSGTTIRAMAPPYLMATKLEAFKSRGEGDFLGSRDLEDVVLLVDGREELVVEVRAAAGELRAYLSEEVAALLAEDRIVDAIFGFLRPDVASQARADAVVLPRLLAIVTAGAA